MKMILDERGKKYVLKPGEDFQSDLGIVSAEVLDSAEIGEEVKSHLDHTFKIMKPNINDFIDIMDRRCSILLKKDIGLVLAHTGLGSGSRVIDAGTVLELLLLTLEMLLVLMVMYLPTKSEKTLHRLLKKILKDLELLIFMLKTKTLRTESMKIKSIWSF